MLGKLKELLSDWKVTVTLVGGALVVATVFGTCTLEPDVSAPEDAVEDAEESDESDAVDVSSEGEATQPTEAATTENTTSNE